MQTADTTNKLAINIANSWKMYSVRFVTLFSAALSALAAWFLNLPLDCAPLLAKIPPEACTYSQMSLLAKLGIGAASVPLIAAAIHWYTRVSVQSNLTPPVADAKSADSPQLPIEVPTVAIKVAEAISPASSDAPTAKES